jgi:uncharacterized lipoprotein YajG
LYTISTSTTVRAICENNSTTLTNDYSITDSQDYVTTPSREENEQIINKTLASALNRMFQDEQLLACLAG